jgi:hypothetical protein
MCLNDINAEAEEKRWRINRIEKILEDNEKGLTVNREKFKSFSCDVIGRTQNTQLIILSIMGIIAVTLVGIAVADSKNIPDDFIQWTLIREHALTLFVLLSVAILAIYTYLELHKRHLSEKLWKIEKAFHEGLTAQAFMKGFLHFSRPINLVQPEQLKNLLSCYIVVEGGITQNIIRKYEEAKKNTKGCLLCCYQNEVKKETELIGEFYNVLVECSKVVFSENNDEKIFEKCTLQEAERKFFEVLNTLSKPISEDKRYASNSEESIIEAALVE